MEHSIRALMVLFRNTSTVVIVYYESLKYFESEDVGMEEKYSLGTKTPNTGWEAYSQLQNVCFTGNIASWVVPRHCETIRLVIVVSVLHLQHSSRSSFICRKPEIFLEFFRALIGQFGIWLSLKNKNFTRVVQASLNTRFKVSEIE